MKVYFAASISTRLEMRKIRTELELQGQGHQVTSRWIDQAPNDTVMIDGQVADRIEAVRRARKDIQDIDRSDLVAIFTLWPSTSGGLHWEYGYAIGKCKHIVLIGPMISVFFALPNRLEWFQDVDEFLKWMAS